MSYKSFSKNIAVALVVASVIFLLVLIQQGISFKTSDKVYTNGSWHNNMYLAKDQEVFDSGMIYIGNKVMQKDKDFGFGNSKLTSDFAQDIEIGSLGYSDGYDMYAYNTYYKATKVMNNQTLNNGSFQFEVGINKENIYQFDLGTTQLTVLYKIDNALPIAGGSDHLIREKTNDGKSQKFKVKYVIMNAKKDVVIKKIEINKEEDIKLNLNNEIKISANSVDEIEFEIEVSSKVSNSLINPLITYEMDGKTYQTIPEFPITILTDLNDGKEDNGTLIPNLADLAISNFKK